jgi:sugar-specific transcriptional regulator TrmB
MALEEDLKEFGLTDKEAKVYLALLKLGTALVQDVAKEAGTYRTYTYEILKSLKEKGIVSYVIKSGKQYFEAAEPGKMLSIMKEKENKLSSIMPELKGIYKSAAEKPKVELYEGKEGLKTILDDLVRTKKEILVYSSTRKQQKLLQFYFPNFIRRRVKERIKTKVLTERSAETLELCRKDREELREMRFLPAGMEFPTATNIYGNKVAILSLEKEIVGVIIESKSIADTQRMVFNLLWKMAEKQGKNA